MRFGSILALVSVVAPIAAQAACNQGYYQCGGKSFTGEACCATGFTCKEWNEWYSQCVPAEATTAPVTVAPTTTPTPTTATPTTAPVPTLPSYNTHPKPPNKKGMELSAKELAKKLTIGINLGDSLEATGNETGWGRPVVTKLYIDSVKAAGFDAIRIPVAWDQHANQTTGLIDPAWMARVKEVVQYAIDAGFYAWINIHWDLGWLETHVTPDYQARNNVKLKAYWEQIATAFEEYDEHLMFACMNEPNGYVAENMAVLTTYHQTFVSAVRSTGGHNAYRNLVVQGPSTDSQTTYDLMHTWPTDSVPGRLIFEFHYYTPWNFCGMGEDSGTDKAFYYWGQGHHSTTDLDHNPTWGEEGDMDKYIGLMKTKFVDNDIPVFVGEFAPIDRRDTLKGDVLALSQASRAYYDACFVARTKKTGLMIPFYWETGSMIDRNTGVVTDPEILAGIMYGLTANSTTNATTA